MYSTHCQQDKIHTLFRAQFADSAEIDTSSCCGCWYIPIGLLSYPINTVDGSFQLIVARGASRVPASQKLRWASGLEAPGRNIQYRQNKQGSRRGIHRIPGRLQGVYSLLIKSDIVMIENSPLMDANTCQYEHIIITM